MITISKIEIYKKYNGEIDSWSRSANKKELSIINDSEWYIIESLINDIFLSKAGRTSDNFNLNLEKRLLKFCENENTIDKMKSLVSYLDR